MNICIVPAGYKPIPPTKGGAVETIVNNFLLVNENIHSLDFTVLSVDDPEARKAAEEYKYTKFVFFSGNEKIDNLYYWFVYRLLKKLFKVSLPDYILKRRMIKYLEKEQYKFDWIVFEAGEIEPLKYFSRYIECSKFVFHSHGEIKCTRGLDTTVKAYITVSEYIKKIWDKSCNTKDKYSKSYVLKNGINQSAFDGITSDEERKNNRKYFGFAEKDIVLVFVGRIIPEKGVIELLNSMNFLPENYKLLIVGSSNFGTKTNTKYEKKVKEIIDAMSNRIAFTGFVHNSQIAKMYNVGDISIIPSMFEDPAPLVVMEAMAAGLPIITTGSGGIKEYCDSSCALFVDRNKDISLNIAKNIMKLGEDKQLRLSMGKNAKNKAKEFTDVAQYKQFVYELNYLSGVDG